MRRVTLKKIVVNRSMTTWTSMVADGRPRCNNPSLPLSNLAVEKKTSEAVEETQPLGRLKGMAGLFLISFLSYSERGILNLDNTTFDKIVDGYRNVFVRFDKEYAYGEEHDEWKAFAVTVGESDADLLVADVAVSEYGDKMNEDLARRFSIALEDFPQYRLFKSSVQPIRYLGKIDRNEFLLFVQRYASVWIGLPGQVKQLDSLAKEFSAASSDREEVLRKTQVAASAAEGDLAKYYVKVMTKALGDAEFVVKETSRLSKMQSDSSVKESKKKSFRKRLNILSSFQ